LASRKVAPGIYEIIKNKKYRIRWDGPPDPATGKRQQLSVTFFGTLAQAKRFRREQIVSASRGEQPSSLTLNELTERWRRFFLMRIDEGKRKLKTLESYDEQLNKHILPALGHRVVEKLLPIEVVEFLHAKRKEISRLGKPLSPRTVDYLYDILRSVCNFGVKARLIKSNPADLTGLWDPPDPDKKKVNIWTVEQVQDFFTKITGHRFYVLFLICLLTGLRPGEALGLKWPRVDLQNGFIEVAVGVQRLRKTGIHEDTPKSHRSRLVAIGPFLVHALKQHRTRQRESKLRLGQAYNDQGWVFCREDGKLWDPKLPSRDLAKLVTKHKMPPVTPHDFRHMYTTHRRENGDDLYDIALDLGHWVSGVDRDGRSGPGLRTTDGYNHPSFERKKDAALRLEQRLFTWPQQTNECEIL